MSNPESPLDRLQEWVNVELDLGDGRGVQPYRRDTNVMPQWAGSCWYQMRYIDPTLEDRFVAPENEKYWMGPRTDVRPDHPGGIDLYVGGVEHAVLHLLYARFWHKILFDLGHVSSIEPYARLFNQGYIMADSFKDARGINVEATEVDGNADDGWTHNGEPVTREYGKMGKSLKNAVSPDEMYEQYGADTLRLLRDDRRPARRFPSVGDARCGRHVPVPAAALAQRGGRRHRRVQRGRHASRRRHAANCCTRRSTRYGPRWMPCGSTLRSPS